MAYIQRAIAPLLVLSVLVSAACGGGDGNTSDTATPRSTTAVDSGTPAATPAVRAQAGDIDQDLATRGERLFSEKICNTCHSIGAGRLVGPDLAGVTERRTREWILAMVMNPDSMLRADSIARRLFGEYMTPMVNQNINRDDATALYEFLRSESDGAN